MGLERRVLGGLAMFLVFPVRAVNLDPAEVAAADAILRLTVTHALGSPLASLATVPTSVDDAALQADCAARRCERYLVVDVVRIGGPIFVTMALRDATGNERAWYQGGARDPAGLVPVFTYFAGEYLTQPAR